MMNDEKGGNEWGVPVLLRGAHVVRGNGRCGLGVGCRV
jgi:hypothetical protein